MNSTLRSGKFLAGLSAAVLACGLHLAPAEAAPSLVVDLKTGVVLAEEDATQRWYPASLSKLMTAYVVFRAIQAGEVTLKSPVRMSKNAAKEPPSKMGYKPGSILTIDNALKILMVKSANDVATAVGESIAGSQKAFADRMNAESRRLGMTGSHWVNAHGLHAEQQYSTARDLALLAVAIRKEFPQFADYFTIEGLLAGQTKMPNHNTLIGRFEGADGMKTGFICPSGFNVIASATRGERTVIAVVVGAPSIEERAQKAAELLAKGFDTNPAVGPSLAALKSSGPEQDVAPNMRPVICSEEARTARMATRGEDGSRTVTSPHLVEMDREPTLVVVELGGATGPKAPNAAEEVEYANVPIPTPRPDYTPSVSATAVQ